MTKKVIEVIELLEDNGWVYLKSRGDHHKFKKAGAAQSVIVPGKRSDDLAPGTLGAILRKTGLKFK